MGTCRRWANEIAKLNLALEAARAKEREQQGEFQQALHEQLGLEKQLGALKADNQALEALAQETKPQFTTRDAQRLIAHNRAKAEVRPVLELLSLHNFIARTTARRSDSEAWLVNPRHVETWQARFAACAGNLGHSGHFNDCRR